MTLSEAIRARRSVRAYTDAPIPEEHVRALLEAAMLSPSARNARPWEFFVTAKKDLITQLAAVSPYAGHVAGAPLAIVVCGPREERPGGDYWPQDCGAAIQNLLLQAVELGYGTCWCGLYPNRDRAAATAALLGTDLSPVALISVGVPAEAPAMRGFYEESKVHIL